jgi:hypothetical protein
MKIVESYLKLQQMRYGTLKVQITAAKGFNTTFYRP